MRDALSPWVRLSTRLSALYNISDLVANRTIIMLDEFWQLQRCGLVPEIPALMPSDDKTGECISCKPNTKYPIGHVMDWACSKAGSGFGHALEWDAMARGPELYIEACCTRKNDGQSKDAHFSWPYMNEPKVRRTEVFGEFNLPRKMAANWIERNTLAKNGFIAVHWRSEKCC